MYNRIRNNPTQTDIVIGDIICSLLGTGIINAGLWFSVRIVLEIGVYVGGLLK